jgi:hypothetical protein
MEGSDPAAFVCQQVFGNYAKVATRLLEAHKEMQAQSERVVENYAKVATRLLEVRKAMQAQSEQVAAAACATMQSMEVANASNIRAELITIDAILAQIEAKL